MDIQRLKVQALLKQILGDSDVLFLDTETTGISDTDEVIELAIVDSSGYAVFDGMFKPDVSISPGASKVNGITDEMLADKPEFLAYSGVIADALCNKIIVGWNIGFDIGKLEYMFRKCDIDFVFARDTVCVVDLMKEMGIWLDTGSVFLKQNEVGRAFGIDEERHRAVEDVRDMINIAEHTARGGMPDVLPYIESMSKRDKILAHRQTNGAVTPSKPTRTGNVMRRSVPGEQAYVKYVDAYKELHDIDSVAERLGVQRRTVALNLLKAFDAGAMEYVSCFTVSPENDTYMEQLRHTYNIDTFREALAINKRFYHTLSYKMSIIGLDSVAFCDYMMRYEHGMLESITQDNQSMEEIKQ